MNEVSSNGKKFRNILLSPTSIPLSCITSRSVWYEKAWITVNDKHSAQLGDTGDCVCVKAEWELSNNHGVMGLIDTKYIFNSGFQLAFVTLNIKDCE